MTESLTSHPQYRRWQSFVQRCDNPKNPAYKAYGGRGIRVDESWSGSNPEGFNNFKNWIEEQRSQHPKFKEDPDTKFEVVRKSPHDNIGPATCSLMTEGAGAQIRRTAVLTAQKVVELRREKKADPERSLSQMEHDHNLSVATLSRCLRGVTWASVNEVEKPLKTLVPEQNDSRKVIHAAQG